MLHSYQEIGALTAHFEVGLGYNRATSLDQDGIFNMTQDIVQNKASISSARIYIDADQKIELFDLFENTERTTIRLSIPSRGEIGFEYLTNEMVESSLIPTVLTIAYAACCLKKIIAPFENNDNFPSAIGGAIAALAIMLSLFGIIISILIPAKGTNSYVEKFFQDAGPEKLKHLFRGYVLLGLVCIFLSFLLFFLTNPVRSMLFLLWFWLFLYLLCSTYRMISLFIELLMTNFPLNNKSEDENVITGDRKKRLDDKLCQMNEPDKK